MDSGQQRNNQPTKGSAKVGSGGGSDSDSNGSSYNGNAMVQRQRNGNGDGQQWTVRWQRNSDVVHRGGRLLIFWRMSKPSQVHKKLVSDIHRIKTVYIHLIYAILRQPKYYT